MRTRLAGIELLNPIGLAAGFDKNANLVPGIENLGFGFVEIGTVTPRPQLGNARPRMLRVPEKHAIVNRMGFNNDGAELIASHLKKVRDQIRVPLGINLGKNRDTPNSEAAKDYEKLFKSFHGLASYFVINISSPNTPGLRDLQSGEFVRSLGEKILQLRIGAPVFIKLAPDLANEDLKAACELCGTGRPYSGVILTNTIPTDLGGLSGAPLKAPSLSTLKLARQYLESEVPVISVGGIESVDDVLERFRAGANAIQIYTGLIYQGPGLPGKLLRGVQAAMRRQGVQSLNDLRQH